MTTFTVELDEQGAPIRSNTLPWLRRRSTGLGASDAPGWLGMSPYITPRDVYMSKVSDVITDEQTEAMEFGHRLEPVILQTVADRHGVPDSTRHRYLGDVVPGGGLVRSVEFPHLLSSFDGMIVEPDGTAAPINAKNVSVYRRKSFEQGEYGVPDDIAVQVFHEAIVAGTDHAYVAPFFGNTMPEPIRLDLPDDFRAWYIDESAAWWDKHPAAHVEPAPTLGDDLAEIWQGIPGAEFVLTDELLEYLRQADALKARVKSDEETIAELLLKVKAAAGDATELYRLEGDRRVLAATWRPNKAPREVFHRDELFADHPEVADLIAAYTRRDGVTPRPFLIK